MAFRVFAVLLAGLMAGFFCGCSDSDKSRENSDEISVTTDPIDSLVLELSGQSGRSVFEITKDEHRLEYVESAVGVFVHVIDSIETCGRYGWMYSVNDSMGQVASDKYITHDTDMIKWHYRKYDH